MFSTRERLKKRTGKNPVDRFKYLGLLVEEFRTTKSESAKEQVLANLANFAYDPINYGYLRQLSVIDLFLGQLENLNGPLVEFAIAGLCNLCLDKENKEHIIRSGGVAPIIKCLISNDIETILSAITTLMFLVTPESKKEITAPEVVQYMTEFSRNDNPRIRNLAVIFLEDFCQKG